MNTQSVFQAAMFYITFILALLLFGLLGVSYADTKMAIMAIVASLGMASFMAYFVK